MGQGTIPAHADPAQVRTGRRIAVLWVVAWGLLLHVVGTAPLALAAELRAGPATYREMARTLRAGDTMVLEPGNYPRGLDIHDISGTAEAPIAIVGAPGTRRSVFVAAPGRNTISISNAAFVRIADLDLEGRNAPVDAVKAEGTAHFAHDIVIEGLRISGYARSQQNVGISTKCPAWNWTIRGNRITEVGTGIYLGNSDGSAPFVRGVVEGNVVTRTLGYSMQIKHQVAWPEQLASLPESGQTIVRYNTFAKDASGATGNLARPNLLLGHWPLAGHGSRDAYLVYGNLFFENPAETLLQAEGNVTLYNNVFVNRSGDAVAIRAHNDVPRNIEMFHNTIVARDTGVLIGDAAASARQTIAANAIFSGAIVPEDLTKANAVYRYDEAPSVLRSVPATGVYMDLAPRGELQNDHAGRAGPLESLPDVDLDFDRKRRTTAGYGAYVAGFPAAPDRFRK